MTKQNLWKSAKSVARLAKENQMHQAALGQPREERTGATVPRRCTESTKSVVAALSSARKMSDFIPTRYIGGAAILGCALGFVGCGIPQCYIMTGPRTGPRQKRSVAAFLNRTIWASAHHDTSVLEQRHHEGEY